MAQLNAGASRLPVCSSLATALCLILACVPAAAQADNLRADFSAGRDQTDAENDELFISSEPLRDFNIGLNFAPFKGFSLRADAWRVVDSLPGAPGESATTIGSVSPEMGAVPEDFLQNVLPLPHQGANLNGVDLGLSYSWASDNFGDFRIGTRASMVYSGDQRFRGADFDTLPQARPDAIVGGIPASEFQSSLVLDWQIGNHSASAITNYFDAATPAEREQVNLDELNEFVDEMATFDLQYGYSVSTGRQNQNRAVFSLGVRNLFDEKPESVREAGAAYPGSENGQSGRVAYGSIKYQF